MDANKITYYLLSDDNNLKDLLNSDLKKNGLISGNGNKELDQYSYIKENIDVLIMDINYGGRDVYNLATIIRERGINIPIIFIDLHNVGYNLSRIYLSGGNDFIKNPFCASELTLRIQALLQKDFSGPPQEKHYSKIGNYYFSYLSNCLIVNGKKISLSGRETEILKLLIARKDDFVTKSNILKKLWGEDNYFTARSLDVFISKIRKIFKEDGQVKIYTLRNLGYKITDGLSE